MTSPSHSTYKPQLIQQHVYDSPISKQHGLAKYWLESILQHELPAQDLYSCLKDGLYLCQLVTNKISL